MDENKRNNCDWNLAWCTNQENKRGEFSDTLTDYGMYSDLDPKKFDEVVKEYISMLRKKFRAA